VQFSDPPQLLASEVHIWQASLQTDHRAADRANSGFRYALSEDERVRAERYLFPEHRRRFVARHGILREILARYLQVEPATVQFEYLELGKPQLARPADARLQFNISHSGDLALYAVALDSPVGVDIEIARPVPDCLALASRFFSPVEYQGLLATPPALQEAAFLRCWTRKEAFVKAHGKGLSLPLDGFTVTFDRESPPRVLDATVADPSEWVLQDVGNEPEYFGSVAVRGNQCQVVRFEWGTEVAPLRRQE